MENQASNLFLRMRLMVNFLQEIDINVGIFLSGRKFGVPQAGIYGEIKAGWMGK